VMQVVELFSCFPKLEIPSISEHNISNCAMLPCVAKNYFARLTNILCLLISSQSLRDYLGIFIIKYFLVIKINYSMSYIGIL
jgi:hypothetical protein